MPNDADAPITFRAGGGERAFERVADRMELVITSHDLDQPGPGVAKDGEIPHQRQQTGRVRPPSISVPICRVPLGARVSPSTVRHGMNRSRSAVREPMQACKPSAVTNTALVRNSEGI